VEVTNEKIEKEIHKLIHKLLLMAEDDPAEIYSVHRKENLIKH
jgi:hypothetical protein